MVGGRLLLREIEDSEVVYYYDPAREFKIKEYEILDDGNET